MEELLWALAGLLVGAGTTYGWLRWYRPPIPPIVASQITKARPEAIRALAKGDFPTVIQIKVGDEIVYRGPVREGKIIRRRLKLEGKDARLIDEYGRDRG